jgi:hypothetical protein
LHKLFLALKGPCDVGRNIHDGPIGVDFMRQLVRLLKPIF